MTVAAKSALYSTPLQQNPHRFCKKKKKKTQSSPYIQERVLQAESGLTDLLPSK
jgi:hypothetical protein